MKIIIIEPTETKNPDLPSHRAYFVGIAGIEEATGFDRFQAIFRLFQKHPKEFESGIIQIVNKQ